MNNSDREDYVRNHEGLYSLWRRTMGGEKKIRQFVRENRAEIDATIEAARKESRPRAVHEAREDYAPYYMRGRGGYGPMGSPAPVGRAGQSLLPR